MLIHTSRTSRWTVYSKWWPRRSKAFAPIPRRARPICCGRFLGQPPSNGRCLRIFRDDRQGPAHRRDAFSWRPQPLDAVKVQFAFAFDESVALAGAFTMRRELL